MMWDANGKDVSVDRFKPFDPLDRLYEFDGPRVFTVRDSEGELNLAYWCDEDEEVCRFVVVPTTLRTIEALRNGSVTVRDALSQPRCWLCDVTHAGDIAVCRRVEFDSIPQDALPAPGTMLLPTLEPLLTLRATGDEILPGQIPGSVIRTCVEGVQKTFKFLSEYVLGMPSHAGRPDKFLRRLFDLPMQRVGMGSFELSFRMPIEEHDLFTSSGQKSPEAETLDEVCALVNKGLRWVTSEAGEHGVYPPDDPDESAVVLRALKELTPSSQGSIERLELKGRLVGSRAKPLFLDRSARQRVNEAIRNRSLEPRLVELEGRIRELDKDRLSFELREIVGPPQTQRFVFDEELLEEVFLAFQEDVRVRVAGGTFPVKNLSYALALSRVAAAEFENATPS